VSLLCITRLSKWIVMHSLGAFCKFACLLCPDGIWLV
jgi:hypothetical protein